MGRCQRRTRTWTLTSSWVGKVNEDVRVRLDRVEAMVMGVLRGQGGWVVPLGGDPGDEMLLTKTGDAAGGIQWLGTMRADLR